MLITYMVSLDMHYIIFLNNLYMYTQFFHLFIKEISLTAIIQSSKVICDQ